MSVAAEAEVKKLIIPLADITVDPALQVRGFVDPEVVEKYRQVYRDTGPLGRLTLFRERQGETFGPMFLGDGFHRIDAYLKENAKEAPCELREGTRSDALLYALKRNGQHGAPMTNAQKRHAANTAVLDPKIGMMSDKDIAQMIGCSPSFIGECRRGETPESKAAKKQRRSETPGPKRDTKSGKSETESPAPRSATARERKPKDPPKPTKAAIIKDIQEKLDTEQIEEKDLCKIMESPNGEFREVAKAGVRVPLKIVGKNGRVQVEVPVIVRELSVNEIVLKYEDGKLTVGE